ncbi:MAG: hypothetical protein LBG58_10630, partial [Planctomycetaceae bacterium]|nr:hypothetical protein [Planctomycetaceae bacterium]
RLVPVDGWKLKTNSVQHNNKPTGATFRRKVAYLPRLNSYKKLKQNRLLQRQLSLTQRHVS